MGFSRYVWDFSGDGTTTGTPEITEIINGRNLISQNASLNNASFWSATSGAGAFGAAGVDDYFMVDFKYKSDFQPLDVGYTMVWIRMMVAAAGTGANTIFGIDGGAASTGKEIFKLNATGNILYATVDDDVAAQVTQALINPLNDDAYHNYCLLLEPGVQLDWAIDGTVGTAADCSSLAPATALENEHRVSLGAKGDGVNAVDNCTVAHVEWYYHSSVKPNFAKMVAWKQAHPNMAISQGLWEDGEDTDLDNPKSGRLVVASYDFGTSHPANITNITELEAEFNTLPLHGKTVINNEWQIYFEPDEGKNVHVFTESTLNLTARLNPTMTEGDIASGFIGTKDLYKYGYYEMRFKSPTGRGVWPAFWVIEGNHGANGDHDPQEYEWPPEIDFFEIVHSATQDTTKSHHNLIGPETSDHGTIEFSRLTDAKDYPAPFDFADDFHVVGCLWEVDRVSWYVDDVRVATYAWNGGWVHNAAKGSAAALDATVQINLAIGGDFPGDPTDSGIFPCSLEIDWIRIYQ